MILTDHTGSSDVSSVLHWRVNELENNEIQRVGGILEITSLHHLHIYNHTDWHVDILFNYLRMLKSSPKSTRRVSKCAYDSKGGLILN